MSPEADNHMLEDEVRLYTFQSYVNDPSFVWVDHIYIGHCVWKDVPLQWHELHVMQSQLSALGRVLVRLVQD